MLIEVGGTHALRPANPTGGRALQTRGHRLLQRPHLRKPPLKPPKCPSIVGRTQGLWSRRAMECSKQQTNQSHKGASPQACPHDPQDHTRGDSTF